MAEELWRVGGKRSAWMDLASAFDQEATSLSTEERLGCRIAVGPNDAR